MCDPNTIYQKGSFVFVIVYMVLFSALVPLYVVCKARKEFIIEYAGLIIKAMMLCLAHYA